jgi:hypothetical protein
MEVVHSATGVVRSPLVTTVLQVRKSRRAELFSSARKQQESFSGSLRWTYAYIETVSGPLQLCLRSG